MDPAPPPSSGAPTSESALTRASAPVPAPAPTPASSPAPPSIISFAFAGPIQPPASKNFRNACCTAINNGASEIRVLFSSSGGLVEEGFSLHNFLRALPAKLVMHCVGSADSIAMVVFLAGTERFCCADSTFLFHDFGWGSTTGINFTRLQFGEFHDSLESFKTRSQQLLKTRAAFTVLILLTYRSTIRR